MENTLQAHGLIPSADEEREAFTANTPRSALEDVAVVTLSDWVVPKKKVMKVTAQTGYLSQQVFGLSLQR